MANRKQHQQPKLSSKTISARIVFEDMRLANQAIVWPLGSDELILVQKTDTTEVGGDVIKRLFNQGGISNTQHAEDLAQKWFDALAGVFADVNDPAEYDLDD